MNNNINTIVKTVKDFYNKANQAAKKQEEYSKVFNSTIAEEKNAELRREILSMQTQAREQVQASAEAAEQDVKDAAILQGSDLTDDMKLLAAGIKLTGDDLQALADRYAGNETMLRAIRDYAQREEKIVNLPPMADDKLQAVEKIRTGALNLVDSIASNPLDALVAASIQDYGTAPIFDLI